MPLLNASWTATAKTPPAASASAIARSGDRRRLASGAASPSSTIRSTSSHRGAGCEREAAAHGLDRVGLDLGAGHQLVGPVVEVGMHVLQRRRRRADHDHLVPEECRGGVLPCTTRENETVLIVPGGPS